MVALIGRALALDRPNAIAGIWIAHPLLLLQLRELNLIPLRRATQREMACVGPETTLEAGNGTKHSAIAGANALPLEERY